MAAEKNFENKIKAYLKERAWFTKYFANSFTKSGVPDILACVNGFFVAIEVKAENGHPSALQIYNRDKIRENGGISLILYPSQFEEFKMLIDDLIKRPHSMDWNEQKCFDKEGDHTCK